MTGASDAQLRSLKLLWLRHRRPIIGLAAALVTLVGFRLAAPAGPQLKTVTVAAHDLPAGSVLAARDLHQVAWPEGSVPTGILAEPLGQRLAGLVRAGEPLTDARVVGRSLLAGQPAGSVAVMVRLADPAGASLVHVGDRVDVLASAAGEPSMPAGPASYAERVADTVLVLGVGSGAGQGAAEPAVPGSGGPVLGLTGDTADSTQQAPPLLVLAVDQATARRLAAAQSHQLLSVAVLPDGATLSRIPAD